MSIAKDANQIRRLSVFSTLRGSTCNNAQLSIVCLNEQLGDKAGNSQKMR